MSSCDFSSELDEATVIKVWNMVKAFGQKNKIHKNYIFYFEVRKECMMSKINQLWILYQISCYFFNYQSSIEITYDFEES